MSAPSTGKPPGPWPAILTWQAPDAPRMESVRVQLSGNRIRANGQIVAAATADHPAFSAYYDLQTDESGATKRLGLTVILAFVLAPLVTIPATPARRQVSSSAWRRWGKT